MTRRANRLTRREALQIVIHHAGRDAAGTGCGVRPGLQPDELDRLVLALAILWKDAHGYPMSQSDLFNLGISATLPTTRRH